MTTQRILGIPALLFLGACATSGVIPRSELVPQNGPRARISASYSGGIVARRLRASFSVDKSAYVMVGHLGGDGRIRILYPENALASNRVQAKKTYAVNSVAAQYDGAPQLYSFASRAYRSVSARMDSYDGRGNGYLFVIASAYPLDMDDMATDGAWDEYEVEDYQSSWDPRYSINQLAQHVTRGVPYTLDYADSFTTHTFSSYATAMADCSILSSLLGGFMTAGSGLWGYTGFFYHPWNRRGTGLSWYFNRPAMYYTHGYGAFGSSLCDGYFGFGPRYTRMALMSPPLEPRVPVTWVATPPRLSDTLTTTFQPLAPALNGRVPRGGVLPSPLAGPSTESVLPRTRFPGRPTRAGTPSRAGSNSGSMAMDRFRSSAAVFDGSHRSGKPARAGNNSGPDGMRPPASAAAPRAGPIASPATRNATPSHPAPSASPPSAAPTEIIRPPER